MAKDILFDKAAMEKMLKGLDIAADAVGGTIGPMGRNVYYDDPIQPGITNDGVKIASKVILKDKHEDAGAYIIRNVSAQQHDDVGDGTTTVSVLTQAIVHEVMNRPENVMVIRSSLEQAGLKALKLLTKHSKAISLADAEHVALVSSENSGIAHIIAEIIKILGKNPVISVEDSSTFGTEYEIVKGYQADAGFMSPYFANDKSGKATYTDILVLVSEKRIANVQDIKPIFDLLQSKNITQCVIACEDIDLPILGILVANKANSRFQSVVIRASGDTLKDIAGATGATPISDSNGLTFQTVKLSHFGKAKKMVSDFNKTLFIGDGIASKLYAKELEKKAELEPNMYLKKKLEDRAARLKGNAALLKIGAPTDQHRGYLRDKADDAVKATIAALEEGVVEGGGMALWRIGQALSGKTVGEAILKKALQAPLRRIIENAGKDYSDIIRSLPDGKGYDAQHDCYLDMISAGIIDPTKVERCALENAVSSASTFITTHCSITDEPIEQAPH